VESFRPAASNGGKKDLADFSLDSSRSIAEAREPTAIEQTGACAPPPAKARDPQLLRASAWSSDASPAPFSERIGWDLLVYTRVGVS